MCIRDRGREHQNQSRRDEGEGTQTKLQGEEGGDVRRLTGGGGRQAEEQIQPGGCLLYTSRCV